MLCPIDDYRFLAEVKLSTDQEKYRMIGRGISILQLSDENSAFLYPECENKISGRVYRG